MDSVIEKGLKWTHEAINRGYVFVKWDTSEETKECPICHNHSKDGDFYGGNCIWFASAYLFHGMGLSNLRCAGDAMLGSSKAYTRLLLSTGKAAQRLIDKRLEPGSFTMIRKKNLGKLTTKDIRRGDILFYYKTVLFWHTAVYLGDGRIIDCSSETGGISERDWNLGYPCRVALRYSKETLAHD